MCAPCDRGGLGQTPVCRAVGVRTFTDFYGLWRLFSSRHYQRVDALGGGVKLVAFGGQTGAASAATTRLGSHRTTPLSDLSDPSDPSDLSDTPPANNKKNAPSCEGAF